MKKGIGIGIEDFKKIIEEDCYYFDKTNYIEELLKDINSGTYNSEGGSKVGRGLTTKVRVKNGDTILLGGLKKSIQQNIESKIPILGDIPIISFFFKNTTKKNENSDMYIKLKVEIDE